MSRYTNQEKLFSIGEASRICNVSTKTLRFYDKIGVVTPDYVSEENGYRYYSSRTLLKLPVIKYYKQLGFKLEEMSGLLTGKSYHGVEKNFQEKRLKRKNQKKSGNHREHKAWNEHLQKSDLRQ